MSRNGPKSTSLMTSLTKAQTRRLADPFEPMNSSLAQSAEELWHW